jgi:AcrR family transcriptional regulator
MLDRRRACAALELSAPIRAADPRRRVLSAFVQTVARRGYDRTTIDDVLKLAEVPQPLFAEHFEDKLDCLLTALDELIAQTESALGESVGASATAWPKRVRLGLQTLLTALARNPDDARMALVECLSAGEPAVERLRDAVARCVPLLEEGREALSETGVGGSGQTDVEDADPEHLPYETSEAIAGGIASIVHRRVLEDRTAELPGLLPDLLYFALMPYIGHRRALAESAAAG